MEHGKAEWNWILTKENPETNLKKRICEKRWKELELQLFLLVRSVIVDFLNESGSIISGIKE